ncbi:MAG: sigma-70 family RNA polymerase sigma factor [Rhodobacteraceae bacterium]|jgi:RNA polymerase sigma-70 factor (ECF subfamily)|nr:sigma-70 family RNA polymerase sigma factor [Paracoccaceae bacterium]
MPTRDDIEAWIARAALGDRAAFEALYAATSAKLYGLLIRILKDEAEAEDVLQDVYVKIWHNAGRYAANGMSPMTWLITIARNAGIDRLRARPRPLAAESAEAPDPAPGPEAAAIAAGEARRIAACLAELEPDRAAAVRGAYLDGLSYEALARRHGVPLNTMRTWLRRSLLRLRECLSR